MQSLDTAHAIILNAAIRGAFASGRINEESSQWVDIFHRVRDYLFVGLCDEDIVEQVLEILRLYITESPLKEQVLKVY